MGSRGRKDGIALANVVVQDSRVHRSAAQQVRHGRVPREAASTRRMARHGTYLGERRRVPDLDVAGREADGQVRGVGHPLDRGGVVGGVDRGQQRLRGARVGVPEVDRLGERDGERVVGTPVEDVEVVVVGDLRRVEHAHRRARDRTTPRVALDLSARRRGREQHAVRIVVAVAALGSLVLEREDLALVVVVEHALAERTAIILLRLCDVERSRNRGGGRRRSTRGRRGSDRGGGSRGRRQLLREVELAGGHVAAAAGDVAVTWSALQSSRRARAVRGQRRAGALGRGGVHRGLGGILGGRGRAVVAEAWCLGVGMGSWADAEALYQQTFDRWWRILAAKQKQEYGIGGHLSTSKSMNQINEWMNR